jgi:hypothetical protein
MKNIIIKPRHIKRELTLWMGFFIFTIGVNTISIIFYNTQWIELLTQWHIMLAISVFLYLLTALIRLAILGIKNLIRK